MYDEINRTELVEIARELGLENINRLMNRQEIYALLAGATDDKISCPLEEHRQTMQRHIQRNFRRLRTQLPGCTGKCVSYGCPELVVLRCWEAFKGDIL